jgi:proteasome accessory factor A
MGNNPSIFSAELLPRLCGADIELGNFIVGDVRAGGTGYEASRALLAEIDGLPQPRAGYLNNWWSASPASSGYGCSSQSGGSAYTNAYSYDLQDVSRRYLLSNGGCAYIDLDHVELCLPEVIDAFDHVAAWHGMLQITRDALHRANQSRPLNSRIQVLVNNSDGQGNSYGSHLNFMISRRTYDNIFLRKSHYLQFLASFQISNILLTGQGKVGAENGRPFTPYQISQRADFFEILQGPQTTYKRPIVNARDEALCGKSLSDDPSAPARLHVIFFDSALAHGSALFRVGPMQLILTLLELGLVNARLILDDPLAALLSFSHDPTLQARAELIDGEQLTLLELQKAYLEEVKRHADRGLFNGIVPHAEEIIALWEETLNSFTKHDFITAARHGIDWVLKLMAIERAMDQHAGLDWRSPEIKVIDHLYSSLDNDGLYWAYESSGLTRQLVTPEHIARFTENPPPDTRAWTRAMLLRRAAPGTVVSVDWDTITFKLLGRYNWPVHRTFNMANPLGFTRAEAQHIFDNSLDLADLLDALESESSDRSLTADALSAH